MRKLASIQLIDDLRPIMGAGNLECAKILGWEVVVRKGEFKVGEKCCFFEIGSILPEAPWSEFMASRKYRVKTMKLRGQLSQGLALPVRSIFEDTITLEVGQDVTGILNVKKYEAPVKDTKLMGVPGKRKKEFPVEIGITEGISQHTQKG